MEILWRKDNLPRGLQVSGRDGGRRRLRGYRVGSNREVGRAERVAYFVGNLVLEGCREPRGGRKCFFQAER